MFKNLRIFMVRMIVELVESLFFNSKLLRLYKKIFDNQLRIVIDVGANLGQTIDLVLKINPQCRVYAFEPNPKLYKHLSGKYSKNTNIKLFQLGISNISGNKLFHENVLHSTSTLEDLNFSSKYLIKKSKILGVEPEKITRDTYSIEVISLSDFITTHLKDETIDLIKIDTEGHEYHCLVGLFSKGPVNCNYIQLENHNDDMYVNNKPFVEISKLLFDNSFKVLSKIKHGFGDIDEVIFEK